MDDRTHEIVVGFEVEFQEDFHDHHAYEVFINLNVKIMLSPAYFFDAYVDCVVKLLVGLDDFIIDQGVEVFKPGILDVGKIVQLRGRRPHLLQYWI